MTNSFVTFWRIFDEFSSQNSSKFVKISQSSSKFVNIRQNFVKIRQKIRHEIGFYSDEQQNLQKKETILRVAPFEGFKILKELKECLPGGLAFRMAAQELQELQMAKREMATEHT